MVTPLSLGALPSTSHALQRAYHVSTCVLLPSLPLGVASDDDDDTPEERKVMRDVTWAGINYQASHVFCKNRTHLRSISLSTGKMTSCPLLNVFNDDDVLAIQPYTNHLYISHGQSLYRWLPLRDGVYRGPVPPPVCWTSPYRCDITHICALTDGTIILMLTSVNGDHMMKLVPNPSATTFTPSDEQFTTHDMGTWMRGRTISIMTANDERFLLLMMVTGSTGGGVCIQRVSVTTGLQDEANIWPVMNPASHIRGAGEVGWYRSVTRGANDEIYLTSIGFGPAQIHRIGWQSSKASAIRQYLIADDDDDHDHDNDSDDEHHDNDHNRASKTKGSGLIRVLPLPLIHVIADYIGMNMRMDLIAGENMRSGHEDGDGFDARFTAVSCLVAHPTIKSIIYIVDNFGRTIRVLQPHSNMDDL